MDFSIDTTQILPRHAAALDKGRIRGVWRCIKRHGDWTDEQIARGEAPEPYEIIESENIFMYGGVSCLWECLIGNGTASASQALTYFNNSQAAIGVGDSTTAAAATQTDLQASSNKARQAMAATYPQHTDGTTSSSNTITFQSTFGSSSANFAWNEVAAFNSATLATGRMLNRLVQTFGTKASGSSWTMQLQITIT